jgi:cytoskeletal protein RodZ
MADYYPLLSRAIAGLADQPEVSHDAIYARAREALERQLRGFEPALEEAAILAELSALEATIQRVRQEHAARTAENTGSPDRIDASEPAETDEPLEDAPATPEPMVRPRMPERSESPARKRTLALFAGIALVAMLVMGLIAVSKRDPAKAPSSPVVIKAPEATGDQSKTEGRLSSADPAPTPPPASPEPAASANSPAPTQQPVSPPPVAQKTPVSNEGRAFMVLEAQGSAPSQFEGKVKWAFAPDPAIKGQNALKALISFDTAGLTVDFSIARNLDAKLDASHTVMVIFEPKGDIGNVKEMSAVEWRERESQNGTTLAGIVVPVQDNVFMIGLDKTDPAAARNLALLQTQKWMVFEIRFENGRRGAILVEKGANGEKTVADALASWK